MIFAAGLGTRLAPFTLSHPKALVEVGGIPMLQRTILRLKEAGITDIVINVHHFSKQIVDFLHQHNNFGVNIEISDESEELLDTGGALVKASDKFTGYDAVLVHNADILTDANLDNMVQSHKDSRSDVSLLVSNRKSSRYLYFNHNNRLVGWHNVKTGEILPENLQIDNQLKALAFGGIHIINTTAINELKQFSRVPAFSIIPFYVSKCDKLVIRGYQPSEHYIWHDIGTPEKLKEAEIEIILQKKNI